jgi:hypothetical protein
MYVRALDSGSFEELKAGVHGAALGLAAVMCLYNAAAWLQRRERHLGINAIVYGSAIILERQHVAHHRATVRRLALAAAALAAAEAAATVAAAAEAAAHQADSPSGDGDADAAARAA